LAVAPLGESAKSQARRPVAKGLMLASASYPDIRIILFILIIRKSSGLDKSGLNYGFAVKS